VVAEACQPGRGIRHDTRGASDHEAHDSTQRFSVINIVGPVADFLTFNHPGIIIAVLGDVGACLGWMHIETTSTNQSIRIASLFSRSVSFAKRSKVH
jgi:hypothetical protein